MNQFQAGKHRPASAERVSAPTSAAQRGTAAPAFRYTSLIDPRLEHDSCGVGFVASARGKPSHDILQKALTALARLAHRGAVATDGKSSDGVGVLTGIPKKLLLDAVGVDFDENQELGVGMLFLPPGETRAEGVIEACLSSQDLRVLCWRDVPVHTDVLGEIALNSMPVIRQVLVADAVVGDAGGAGMDSMDKRLYLARKQFERQ